MRKDVLPNVLATVTRSLERDAHVRNISYGLSYGYISELKLSLLRL